MNYFKIITLFSFILFLTNCNPKEEIAPENPCGKYIEPSADFIMEKTTYELENDEYIWYNNPFNKKDTIDLGNVIQFSSEFTDTNTYRHTWYVGKDVFTDYKVWRDFFVFPNTFITIYHAMKWKPNKLCNPNDDGYDSTSFTFQVIDRFKALNTIGKYKFVYDTLSAPIPQDSIDVEIYFSANNKPDSVLVDPKPNTNGNLRIKGLYTEYPNGEGKVPSNKDPISSEKRIIANSYIVASPNNIGFIGDFYLYIDNNSYVRLTYTNNYRKYSLKGRKIN